MKATSKQKQICDLVIEQANIWKKSNDLDSETNQINDEKSFENIYLSFRERDDLTWLINNLLECIKIIE